MTTATDLALTVSRTIAAAPGRLFDAWLDPALFARIMLVGSEMTLSGVTTDPRVGGGFTFTVRMNGEDKPHRGTYLDIDRPNRLRFTWVSPYSAEDSEVTITFAPKGDATEVTLTHIRFVSEGSRDGHGKVWTEILGNLEQVAA